MHRETILICDDEPNILKTLSQVLSDEGYQTLSAPSGEMFRKLLEDEVPDVVFLDVWLGNEDGLVLLSECRERFPNLPVIVMSGHGTIETAVRAIKSGAFDYIEKPLSLDKVLIAASHALKQKGLEEENRVLRTIVSRERAIVGRGVAIEALLGEISRAAPSNGWVLIQGENGTGKELVAREIHRLSHRSQGPFIDVNCAAIPENLIESELFGYEKGAFTGAVSTRKGKFELASGGTLFLDEIGDMSPQTQAKVLRVLQERVLQRLGGHRDIPVDVRVVAASNKDLRELIRLKEFREDLFYRLNVIPVHVPALRDRPEDIPVLIAHFMTELSEREGLRPRLIDQEALDLLISYPWPGNVRELKNLIERLLIMSSQSHISEGEVRQILGSVLPQSNRIAGEGLSLKEAREVFEKDYIQSVLDRFGGNITRASEALKVDRTSLHRKLRSMGSGEED
jgi:two-component system nitrogen regulation response regulator NtrX